MVASVPTFAARCCLFCVASNLKTMAEKIVSVKMPILIWLMETKEEEEEDLASKMEGRHTDQNVSLNSSS